CASYPRAASRWGSKWGPGLAKKRGACFFSSRRRHTRSKRDWSSDVCSSDLADNGQDQRDESVTYPKRRPHGRLGEHFGSEQRPRSEERRVGEEWRYRRGGAEEKKQAQRADEGGRGVTRQRSRKRECD